MTARPIKKRWPRSPAEPTGIFASSKACRSAWVGGAPLPEPSTQAMMLIGLAGLGFAAFRRKGGCSGLCASQPSGALLHGNVAGIG
jgi:hypothetical protein